MSTPIVVLSDSDDDDDNNNNESVVTEEQKGDEVITFSSQQPKEEGKKESVNELSALIRVAKETDAKRGWDGAARAAPELYPWHTRVITAATRQPRGSSAALAESVSGVYKNGTLHNSDLRTLTQGKWLNDEVINCYFELVAASSSRENGQEKGTRCLAMTTFFYTALTGRGYDYKRVEKWTRGVNVLSDYTHILVPIHRINHWTLAVVNIREHKIAYYDSLGRNDGGKQVCQHLSHWLRDETITKMAKSEEKEEEEGKMKVKRKEEVKDSWQTVFPRGIPLQKNGSDCGVFMCKYAECVAFGIPFNFSQKDMPRIRDSMIYELVANTLLITPK